MILFSVSVSSTAQGTRSQEYATGILAAKLSDDVVEVLLRAQSLPFKHFHESGHLPHIGDGGFLDGHALAFRAMLAHGAPSASLVLLCMRPCTEHNATED